MQAAPAETGPRQMLKRHRQQGMGRAGSPSVKMIALPASHVTRSTSNPVSNSPVTKHVRSGAWPECESSRNAEGGNQTRTGVELFLGGRIEPILRQRQVALVRWPQQREGLRHERCRGGFGSGWLCCALLSATQGPRTRGTEGLSGRLALTSRDACETSLPFPDRLKLVGDGQQTVEELAVRVVEEGAAAAEATPAAAVALESSAVQAERRPTWPTAESGQQGSS